MGDLKSKVRIVMYLVGLSEFQCSNIIISTMVDPGGTLCFQTTSELS